MSEAETRRYVK